MTPEEMQQRKQAETDAPQDLNATARREYARLSYIWKQATGTAYTFTPISINVEISQEEREEINRRVEEINADFYTAVDAFKAKLVASKAD